MYGIEVVTLQQRKTVAQAAKKAVKSSSSSVTKKANPWKMLDFVDVVERSKHAVVNIKLFRIVPVEGAPCLSLGI